METQLKRAMELRCAGRLDEAAALLDQFVSDSEAIDSTIALELSEIRVRQGRWSDALAVLQRGLADAAAASGRVPLQERITWVLFRSGRVREAAVLAAALAAELAKDGLGCDDGLLARLHNTLGGVAWYEGRLDDAVRHVTDSIAASERCGDLFASANGQTNRGVLQFTRGVWQEAAASFQSSEELRERLGWRHGRASNLLNLGLLRMSLGEHEKAEATLQKSLEISRETGERNDAVRAQLALAQLALVRERLPEARERLALAMAAGDCITEDDVVQGSCLHALLDVTAGAYEVAVERAAAARLRAREASLTESEADSCRTLGLACLQAGRHAEAEQALRDSLSLSQRAGDPYRRGLALLELGALYGRTERTPNARQTIDEAARVFHEIGAAHDLRRAHTLRAQLAA